MALSDIYQKATLVQIPSGYKAADAELYSVVPNTTAGDFTVSVAADATRVNKDGLVESVAANQARLNYDPTNPQDPTLLLEPTRENIYTYSQDLGQGTTLTNTSVDNDNTTSPNGSLTGNKLTQTSGASIRKTLSSLSGTYALSFFAKKSDLRYLNARTLFVLDGTTPANGNTIIDLDTNTIAYKGTNVTSATIEQYPNNWIKVEIIATDNASGSADLIDFFFTDSDTSTQSSGVAGNGFMWGVQFESGSYATSYIPNLSLESTTRTQDRCINGGDDALFNDSEGVLFADLEALGEGTTVRKISLSNGSTDFVNFNFNATSGRVDFEFGSTSNSFYIVNSTGHTLTNRNKIAIKYKSGDTDCYINGTRVTGSIGTFTLSGLDRLNAEGRATNGTQSMYAKIHQLMVFNEALTDSELTTLTT
jgi:hypothetical protein